jgi:hypothetical protein
MGFLRYLVTESWAFLRVWWWRVAVLVGIAASNALSASRASTWGYFFAFHLLTALWAYDLGAMSRSVDPRTGSIDFTACITRSRRWSPPSDA